MLTGGCSVPPGQAESLQVLVQVPAVLGLMAFSRTSSPKRLFEPFPLGQASQQAQDRWSSTRL